MKQVSELRGAFHDASMLVDHLEHVVGEGRELGLIKCRNAF